MSLEKLEFAFPLRVQRSEKKEMPCPNCNRDVYVTVDYEQRIYRSDDYGFNNRKKRSHEISFVKWCSSGTLFRTNRYHSLREALLEAHKTLDRMGLKK